MGEHDDWLAQLEAEGRKLERFKLIALTYIDERLLDDFAIEPKVEASLCAKYSCDQVLLTVKQEVLGEHLERAEVRCPRDWLQALKERFAPAWLKRRWSVGERVVAIDVRALYPKVADGGVVHVSRSERVEDKGE